MEKEERRRGMGRQGRGRTREGKGGKEKVRKEEKVWKETRR